MEKWRDDDAVNVLLHSKRIFLLDKLEVDHDFVACFKEILSKHEMDFINSRSTRLHRAKCFIETLAGKLTTDVFNHFMCVLPNSLRKEVFQAYKTSKNDN